MEDAKSTTTQPPSRCSRCGMACEEEELFEDGFCWGCHQGRLEYEKRVEELEEQAASDLARQDWKARQDFYSYKG